MAPRDRCEAIPRPGRHLVAGEDGATELRGDHEAAVAATRATLDDPGQITLIIAASGAPGKRYDESSQATGQVIADLCVAQPAVAADQWSTFDGIEFVGPADRREEEPRGAVVVFHDLELVPIGVDDLPSHRRHPPPARSNGIDGADDDVLHRGVAG